MEPPKTIRWFRYLCCFLLLQYIVVSCAGIAFLVIPAERFDLEEAPATVIGILCLLVGVFFSFVISLGLHLPRRPGAWAIGFVLLCLGITNILALPFAAAVMHFWKKPDVREWFEGNPS